MNDRPASASRPASRSRVAAVFAVVLLTLAQVADGVAAEEGRFRRGAAFRHGGQGEARAARQAERAQQRALRGLPPREPQRVPEAAPAPVAPPVEPPVPDRASNRPGRLTPDERRALRQQINEAGRDVYRPLRP